MPTAIKPTNKDILAPYTTLENTSLPRASVPNKYVPLGAVNTSFKLVSAGLNGAIIGANTATIIKNRTIAAPLISSIFLLIFEKILCWSEG